MAATFMASSRIYNTLSLREFRLFWSSSFIHVIGDAATFLAQGWLVLSLTGDSALWVGIASGIRGAGHIGFALVGGILADRLKRRVILAVMALFKTVTFAVLALLIFHDKVQLWHVLVIVFIQGAADGLTAPSFNGLIYDTVGPTRLMNGIAYILAAFQISWTIGSILTGHLINTIGIGSAYALASASFLLSVIPLKLMDVSNTTEAKEESIFVNVVQGIQYVARNAPLRALLLLSMLAEAFGFSYLVMLPVIAKTVFKVGPTGLGYLTAAGGTGSLIGTFVVAGLSNFKDKWKLLTLGTVSAGVSILLFASSPWYELSLILAALIGFSLVAYDAAMNTLLQTLSTDNMRGRVLGLYGMTWGFTPIGGFAVGSVANIAGAPFAIGFGGVIILAYTVGVIARMKRKLVS
jgi:MFS family permease